MTDDWIHPVEVGKIFAQYDYDPTEDTHELDGERVAFSYYYRSTGTIVDRVGPVSSLGGRRNAVYWICVDADGVDTNYHIDDIGVVRSPARSRAHLGPLTALEIGGGRDD